jgi:O-antigen/teichoic acid export membrane protein
MGLTEDDDARHRTLRHSSVVNLALKGIGVAAALGSQVVLARSLPLPAFGEYAAMLALSTIMAILGSGGLALAAVRFLPSYRDRQDWPAFSGFVREAGIRCVIVTILFAGATLIVAAALPPLRPWVPLLAASVPLTVLLCLATLLSGIQQSIRRPLQAEVLNNILRPVVLVGFIGGLVWLGGPTDAATALLLTAAAVLLTLLPAWVAVCRAVPIAPTGRVSRTDHRLWVASGVGFLVPLVAVAAIERMDTIILGALQGPDLAGIYSVATRLAILVSFATAAVNAMLGPMAAELIGRKDQDGLRLLLANGALIGTGLSILVAVGLLAIGPQLMHLFGPAFAAASGAMQILMVGQVIQAGLGGGGALLALSGRNRALAIVMVSSVVAHVVLCVLLIPPFGLTGAALATATTLSISGLVQAVLARRLLGVDPSIRSGLLILLRHRARPAATTARVP